MEPATKPSASISILFVEDDELILKLQVALLAVRFPDVVIHTAGNGSVGLELFKTHTPDIVLTDIDMPEMSGIQMSENIRSLKSDTTFIAITGNSSEIGENGQLVLRNLEGAYFEFDHVIVKPVDVLKLFSIIGQCIGEIEHHVV